MTLNFAYKATKQEENPVYRAMTNVRYKGNACRKTIHRVFNLSHEFSLVKDKVMHLISTDSVTDYKRMLFT